MAYNPAKHHRRSIRLPHYDYSGPGAYFITMVTYQRESLFGEIRNGEMRLSPRGQIADEHWRAIPEHFSHGELGAYIVMPNHVHGIIVIHDRADADASARTGTQLRAPTWRAPTWLAPTWRAPTDNAERFGKPVKGSIPTIIRSYKASVTRRIQRELNGLDRPGPIWQRNYYERIIRDDEEYRRIHLYIEANVANWAKDRETR